MFNKADIQEELEFIHLNFDFSEDCSTELKNFILNNNLANYDTDDILFLSVAGERAIGYNDRGTGSEEEDITEAFFYDTGDEDAY